MVDTRTPAVFGLMNRAVLAGGHALVEARPAEQLPAVTMAG
jgi:hypothetical protein